MKADITEIYRLLNNLIRTGTVLEVDTVRWLCRVQTGELQTTWLNWLTTRAGNARTWWKPSVGEQVLLLSIGGDLTTAFVLPAIYSDENPAPSTAENACVVLFPDKATFQYDPDTGALQIKGVKSVVMEASNSITMKTKKLTITADETDINGKVTQSGGDMSSNGIVVHTHKHSGVKSGGDNSGDPV
ncbi:TPA: phage baseplate assembly protein V [Citrobacter gillenii]